MKNTALLFFFTSIFVVSCNETFYYEETTFLPYKVYSYGAERVRFVDHLHSFEIKAANEEEAKQKADQLFHNRTDQLTLKDFNQVFIDGYTLTSKNYAGEEIARDAIVVGADHSKENKNKAFDAIDLGDNSSKVKEHYKTTERLTKAQYRYFKIGDHIMVQEGETMSGALEYYLKTKTLSTKVSVKQFPFIANFVFWNDRLYQVELLSENTFSSIKEASDLYFQIRELVFTANGFPSWIYPIEDESLDFINRLWGGRRFCGWKYADNSISLGFVDCEHGFKVAYYSSSTIIKKEMEGVVEEYGAEELRRREDTNRRMSKEASRLF